VVDWQIVQGLDLLGELAKSSSVETLRSASIVFLFPAHLRVGNWIDVGLTSDLRPIGMMSANPPPFKFC
jgi:hypothetical protein